MRLTDFQIQRAVELLKASGELLKQADEGIYVKDAMEITVMYDEAECDGNCLMEDIRLFFEEIENNKE